jgi:uncharacterized protein YmfQ (DUF2313 family)
MAFGTWRSPFPRQFGANSTRRITKIYDSIKSELGTALATEPGTLADAENVAAARLLSLADRAIDRRVIQGSDPRKLTEPRLSRWEAILGITASVNDSDQIRRNRVAARLLAYYSGGSGSISRMITEAFAPWTAVAHYNDAATAVMHWPVTSEPTAWTSSVANITIEYVRPAGATDDDARGRVDAARASLDEYLPAWCTFNFHETAEGGTYGFRVGVSKLGLAVL